MLEIGQSTPLPDFKLYNYPISVCKYIGDELHWDGEP
jgi:hypothetical protein